MDIDTYICFTRYTFKKTISFFIVSFPGEYEKLLSVHSSITNQLVQICQLQSDGVGSEEHNEFSSAAFRALVDLLPYQTILGRKTSFPDQNFGVSIT